MIPFYVYAIREPGIAEIVRTGVCDSGQRNAQAGRGENVETGIADQATQYVRLASDYWPTVADKPVMNCEIDSNEIAADGMDMAIIKNVPVGALVVVTDASTQELFREVVTDGQFEQLSESPGTFKVSITLFPYVEKAFFVHAL